MTIQVLVLQLQLDQASLLPELEGVEVDPDPGHEVVPAGAVLVPDGDDQVTSDDVSDGQLKLKPLVPHRVQGLVHGPGLLVVLLEPGPLALIVHQVAERVGVLTPLAVQGAGVVDVHHQGSSIITDGEL